MSPLPIRAVVAFTILVGFGLACGETQTDSRSPSASVATSDSGNPMSPAGTADTASAGGTEAPVPQSTPTRRPPPTPTSDPCLSWDEVTPEMHGETVCMRGVIAKFSQSRQVGTRYSFSDTPNTFFLFSNFWEISNSATGKTVGVGTCVEVTGEIEIQGGIPFIHIDDLITGTSPTVGGFLIYDDPAACG